MSLPKSPRGTNRKLLEAVKKKPCLVCSTTPSDPAHIKTRGAWGPDVVENVVPLCRFHHIEQHQIGWDRFAAKYRYVRVVLNSIGWDLDEDGRLSRLWPLKSHESLD